MLKRATPCKYRYEVWSFKVDQVSNLLRPFAQINSFSNSALIPLLLYGDKDLSGDIDKDIQYSN